MKYRITVRINGKLVDTAYAKNLKFAQQIIGVIMNHDLAMYSLKPIKVVISIKKVR